MLIYLDDGIFIDLDSAVYIEEITADHPGTGGSKRYSVGLQGSELRGRYDVGEVIVLFQTRWIRLKGRQAALARAYLDEKRKAIKQS